MAARKRQRKSQKSTPATPLLPPELGEDEVDVSDEDIKFVASHRQYAGFLSKLDTSNITKQVLGLKTGKKDEANLEAYYEKKVKRLLSTREEESQSTFVDPADVLPIKTLEGELHYRTYQPKSQLKQALVERVPTLSIEERKALLRTSKSKGTLLEASKNEDSLVSKPHLIANVVANSAGEQKLSAADRRKEQKKAQRMKHREEEMKGNGAELPSSTMDDLRKYMSEEERIEEARARMAELGTTLLVNPEESLSSLIKLQEFCTDKNTIIVRMAMLSLLAIFKDIIPGYRIRLPTSKELEMQVSKEIQRLREFETKLLGSYQKYIQFLSRSAKVASLSKPAARCVCTLLEAVPHFNFRDTLLAITVPQMDSLDVDCRTMSCNAVSSLFQNEGKHGGIATTEAVELIADFVKANNCILCPDVIQVFLSITFDEDLRRPVSDYKKGSMNDRAQKKLKQSEKEKKAPKHELMTKLRDEVVADFKESSAMPDASERRKLQTQALSAVFETYFRILKTSLEPNVRPYDRTGEGFKKKLVEFGPHPLLRPCLDGLAKFSHLVNVEFMGDLLAVLKRLSVETHIQQEGEQGGVPLTFADRLHSCVIAFKIVRSNLDALNIDLRDFYNCLYNLLLHPNFARDEHNGEILVEALQVMLWDSRQHDMQRVAAFVKRLASVSLHFGSAEAMAGLVTVQHLLQRYKKCCNLLENDGGGGAVGGSIAVFQGDGTDPDISGALSSVLWELSILSRHYHPAVGKLAFRLSNLDSGSNEVLLLTSKPKDAFTLYSTSKGGFHPSVEFPKKRVKRKSYLHQHNPLVNSNARFLLDDVEVTDRAVSEEATVRSFASHFKVFRDIRENERLRKELNGAVRAVGLFKKFQSSKKDRH